jgi:hypothetical protein
LDREELLKAKAEMSRRDKAMGRASMKLGAIIAVVALVLVFLIVAINGPLTGGIGTTFAYILALVVGIGVTMLLYGFVQYWTSRS